MGNLNTVLYIANSSWYLWNFRASTFRRNLHDGYYVALICPYKKGDTYVERLVAMGCDVLNVPMNPVGLNPLQECLSLFKLLMCMRKIAPRIVFSFTPKANIYTGLSSRVLKVAYVPNVSGLGAGISNGGFLSWFIKCLFRVSLCRAEHIFFQNSFDRELLFSLNLVKKNKSTLLPGSGVATNRFLPCQNRSYSKGVKFVFSGRILLEKGVREYIQAAKIIRSEYGKKVTFDIWGKIQNGRGVSEAELAAMVCSSSVNYCGESDQMDSVLKRYHCMILPTFYGEGVPRSLIEAASSGLAIVTTDIPGCKSVVDDGKNGFLVSPKSVSSLCAAIRRYLALSDVEKEEFSYESRHLAINRFDESLAIEPYVSLIRQVV